MAAPTNAARILCDALARAAVTNADTIPENGHLEHDPGIDSLALHELVVTLETRLSVVIADEEVGCLNTRGLLARLGHPTGEATTQ